MVINYACHFTSHVTLVSVQDVVIDEGHLLDSGRIGVLLPKLIVEVKLILGDLAVCQVLHDLEVAEEILAPAIDDRDPLLIEFDAVKVGQTKGSNGRVDIATRVAHDDAELVLVGLSWAEGARSHSLCTRREPRAEFLHL